MMMGSFVRNEQRIGEQRRVKERDPGGLIGRGFFQVVAYFGPPINGLLPARTRVLVCASTCCMQQTKLYVDTFTGQQAKC